MKTISQAQRFRLSLLFVATPLILLVSGFISTGSAVAAPNQQSLQLVDASPSGGAANVLSVTAGTRATLPAPPISGGQQGTAQDSLHADGSIGFAVVKSLRVNLREQPNRASAVVEEVRQGEALRLVSRSPVGPWYRVRHKETGAEGWVHGNGIVITNLTAADVAGEPQSRGREAAAPARQVAPNKNVGGPASGRTYRNVNGRRVRSPVFSDTVPEGASAKCRDGSYSFSQHRRGTCSHHGGVAEWLRNDIP